VAGVFRFAKRCFAKLWLAGVVLLILIALFISAIRAGLPHLNQYQSQLSDYLKAEHQINFSMTHVTGQWSEGGPTLILQQPKFSNLERFGVDFQAQRMSLQLNITQSLLALSPRFNWIKLAQTKLHLGTFPASSESGVDPAELLINLVNHVDINGASISFDKSYGTLPQIELAQLRWLGGIEKHQLQLAVAADKQGKVPLSLLIDVIGDSTETLSGSVYVNGEDWSWLEDLRLFLPALASDATAQASFELWLDFSASSVDDMVLSLGENQLNWISNGESQQLTIAPALMRLQPNDQGWLFAANGLEASLNQQALLPLDIYASQVKDQLSGQISQLDLSPVAALTGLLHATSSETQTLLSQLAPSGKLQQLKFKQHQNSWHYQGELVDYTQRQVGGIPQLSHLSGQFNGIDGHGQADVVFSQKSLDFGPYFKQPIAINKLSSSLYWGHDQYRSWFGASQLSVGNNDLSSELALQLEFEPAQSPVLSLYGETRLINGHNLDKYLPHVVLSDGLVSYLGEAIQGGESDHISLMWQGQLGQFPYAQHNGVFEVQARINKMQYQFHPDWLPLTDASVDLNFHNASMLLTGHSGRLKQLQFETLITRIDNLIEQPKVEVDVVLNQPQSIINDFVFESVIDNSVGAVLRQLKVDGNIRTQLNIELALDGSQPIISGKVLLTDNDLAINAIDLAVDKVSGDIAFTNGDVIGSNVQGLLYGQPVTFDIKTKAMGSEHYGIELDLKAKWHSDKIPQNWHAYLDDYLSGSLDWQGRVTLKIGHDDVSYQANFKSPMQGLALKLPKPLDKYVDQREALHVSTAGNAAGGQFNLALGSRAEILADFTTTTDHKLAVQQLSLLVGRGFAAEDVVTQDGLSIKIDLDTLELDEWQHFISSIEQGQSQDSFLPPLKHIQANVNQLTVLDQQLSDVSLMGTKHQDYWTINVNSEQAVGDIRIFDQFKELGVEAHFERLVIAAKDETAQLSNSDGIKPVSLAAIKNLPLVDFLCDSCQIAGVEVGQVSFKTMAHQDGIKVTNIAMEIDKTIVKANGFWGFDEDGEYSQIVGSVNTDNVEQALKRFGLSSGIKDSGIEGEFHLTWRDSIYKPQISSLDGDVKWKMSEGHIAEVSDKGARIFSLFSLDSLRRKLVLDFRDVFVEGIFYNYFNGSFVINDGVAVTRNAYMDGIAGGIDVIGSVNLDSQELDYYITFSPNLFSNIPVIAGVVTSTPQVFVLAFAITKVLEPIIDVISQVNFKLSGSIDQPTFVEINRKQKKYKVPEHILPKPEPQAAEETEHPSINGVKQFATPNSQGELDERISD